MLEKMIELLVSIKTDVIILELVSAAMYFPPVQKFHFRALLVTESIEIFLSTIVSIISVENVGYKLCVVLIDEKICNSAF